MLKEGLMFNLFKPQPNKNKFRRNFDKTLDNNRALRLIMNAVTMNAGKKMEDSLKWKLN